MRIRYFLVFPKVRVSIELKFDKTDVWKEGMKESVMKITA